MVVALLILVLVGALLWKLAARRLSDASSGYRFVAPDDDPDFLRELDRRTRRRDDEQS